MASFCDPVPRNWKTPWPALAAARETFAVAENGRAQVYATIWGGSCEHPTTTVPPTCPPPGMNDVNCAIARSIEDLSGELRSTVVYASAEEEN
jgi:hypothetical protein